MAAGRQLAQVPGGDADDDGEWQDDLAPVEPVRADLSDDDVGEDRGDEDDVLGSHLR